MKASAQKNMSSMRVTLPVSHAPMFWLKATAISNMARVLVTFAVFHLPMFWLKANAKVNMASMPSTSAVSHGPMFWLKASASLNMESMLLTRAVSHLPMSSLKALVEPSTSMNSSLMSVMRETSQILMSPYCFFASSLSPSHAATAFWSSFLFWKGASASRRGRVAASRSASDALEGSSSVLVGSRIASEPWARRDTDRRQRVVTSNAYDGARIVQREDRFVCPRGREKGH